MRCLWLMGVDAKADPWQRCRRTGRWDPSVGVNAYGHAEAASAEGGFRVSWPPGCPLSTVRTE